MPVAELGDRVSAIEMAHWEAYFKIDSERSAARMKKVEKPTPAED